MDIKKILVVDDEIGHIDSMLDIFEEAKCNFSILQAFNANDAYKIAEKEVPDIIITDWDMPQANGIELIKQIKCNSKLIDIPIIMCTGIMTESKNLEIALKAGAVDYIRKPIDKIELIARTKANLNLSSIYRKMKNLNESKDRLLSIISHDLRAPVGRIKAYLEILLNSNTNISEQELLESLHLIAKQSSAAFTLLENLFSWARCQMNNLEFDPKEQMLSIAIINNINLLENIAIDKNVSIIDQVKDDVIAFFDEPMISTVIRNLIANAIKFTPANGTITISAKQDETATIVSVQDTGVGIELERINMIFDDSKYDTTHGTNGEKGSGLGLKISMDFIIRHSGKLWVESEPGTGSTFIFNLPHKN